MGDFHLTPLRGCGTALVTPFTAAGTVDEPALRAIVEWQIAEGIDFLVPCGSTGEAATLAIEEHLRVVAITAEAAAGRVPVIGGAASNDTKKAIALSRLVIDAGATHLLHASPMPSRGRLSCTMSRRARRAIWRRPPRSHSLRIRTS